MSNKNTIFFKAITSKFSLSGHIRENGLLSLTVNNTLSDSFQWNRLLINLRKH